MEKIAGPNVSNPERFGEALQDIVTAVYGLIDSSKEHDFKPVDERGVIRYSEESGKYGFQAAQQYDRPSEFLQTLLDMVRVQFEPWPPGTFFLNSNIGFVHQEMPTEPFQLIYASLMGRANQTFADFHDSDFARHMVKCGYDTSRITAMFAVLSHGHERDELEPDLQSAVSDKLGSGFSVDEVLGLMAATVDPAVQAPRKSVYCGYCLDEALGARFRFSVWGYVPPAAPSMRQ